MTEDELRDVASRIAVNYPFATADILSLVQELDGDEQKVRALLDQAVRSLGVVSPGVLADLARWGKQDKEIRRYVTERQESIRRGARRSSGHFPGCARRAIRKAAKLGCHTVRVRPTDG